MGYIYSSKQDYEHVYNIQTIDDYTRYSKKNIERLHQCIEEELQYQKDLAAHKKMVSETPVIRVVNVQRFRDYGTKKIEFRINLEDRPVLDPDVVQNRSIYGTFSKQKSFKGKERSQALKYAENLAEQYNATIERRGFNSL